MCIEQTIVATLARSHLSFTVEAKPTAFFNVDVAVVSFFFSESRNFVAVCLCL